MITTKKIYPHTRQVLKECVAKYKKEAREAEQIELAKELWCKIAILNDLLEVDESSSIEGFDEEESDLIRGLLMEYY